MFILTYSVPCLIFSFLHKNQSFVVLHKNKDPNLLELIWIDWWDTLLNISGGFNVWFTIINIFIKPKSGFKTRKQNIFQFSVRQSIWSLLSVTLHEPHDKSPEWARSVQFVVGNFVFQCRVGARGALHGFLHQPGGQVDGDEGTAGRPQPVPPEPALRLHAGEQGKIEFLQCFMQKFDKLTEISFSHQCVFLCICMMDIQKIYRKDTSW